MQPDTNPPLSAGVTRLTLSGLRPEPRQRRDAFGNPPLVCAGKAPVPHDLQQAAAAVHAAHAGAGQGAIAEDMVRDLETRVFPTREVRYTTLEPPGILVGVV